MLIPYLLGFVAAVQVRHWDYYIASATMFIFFATFILNFKEVALLTRNQWSVQALLLCSCYYQMRYSRNFYRAANELDKGEGTSRFLARPI